MLKINLTPGPKNSDDKHSYGFLEPLVSNERHWALRYLIGWPLVILLYHGLWKLLLLLTWPARKGMWATVVLTITCIVGWYFGGFDWVPSTSVKVYDWLGGDCTYSIPRDISENLETTIAMSVDRAAGDERKIKELGQWISRFPIQQLDDLQKEYLGGLVVKIANNLDSIHFDKCVEKKCDFAGNRTQEFFVERFRANGKTEIVVYRFWLLQFAYRLKVGNLKPWAQQILTILDDTDPAYEQMYREKLEKIVKK
ncbi:MAG: hypothetical protein ABIH21_02650 [Patescibacteria group bacterium]